MIVSGRVSNKMAPVVKRLYEQMPYPKWVIAMGDCASVGGPFNNYAIVQGVDKLVPVDVYVPGCPPRPEALFDALIKLQTKVQLSEPLAERRLKPGRRGRRVAMEQPGRFSIVGDTWSAIRLNPSSNR